VPGPAQALRRYPRLVLVPDGRTGLVVAVPEADAVLDGLRDRFGTAVPPVPAHVTVLFPFLDLPSITVGDLDALGALCAAVEPFEAVFAATARFPGVLWLAPEPAQPFTGLTAAVTARWPQAPPYGGLHDTITPHLTVLDVQARPVAEAGALLDAAEGLLDPHVPVRSRITEVQLWAASGGSFGLHRRLPLGPPLTNGP
jgi:2'-5' RNA ligase